MIGNKFQKGIKAEKAVMDKLSWKIGRKIIRHTNYDEDGNESWQCVVVNGKEFISPDLEIYEMMDDDNIKMRIEVKSFTDFPSNVPFKTKSNILIVSQKQFKKYLKLQNEEEVPIFIVFAVEDGFGSYYFFWASLNDMTNNFLRKEGLYTWSFDKKTEACYFFRAQDFYTDLENL